MNLCTIAYISSWYFFRGSIPAVSRVMSFVKCRFLTFFCCFRVFSTSEFFFSETTGRIFAIFWYVVEQLSKKIPRNFYQLPVCSLGARIFLKNFPKVTWSILGQKRVIFCPLWRCRVPSLINIFSICFLHLVASIVEFWCIHGTWGLRVVVFELFLI